MITDINQLDLSKRYSIGLFTQLKVPYYLIF